MPNPERKPIYGLVLFAIAGNLLLVTVVDFAIRNPVDRSGIGAGLASACAHGNRSVDGALCAAAGASMPLSVA
ncbi:MAG: hypothetical protein R3E79_03510 [Caldilineaceae bacterium]